MLPIDENHEGFSERLDFRGRSVGLREMQASCSSDSVAIVTVATGSFFEHRIETRRERPILRQYNN